MFKIGYNINMAKVYYKKHNVLKFFGIKIFTFNSEYIEKSTDQDDEEIRDDILLHELKGKNNDNL